MSLQDIKNLLPEHARDLKLNLTSVLSVEGAPGLSEDQIGGIALASAIAARNPDFTARIEPVTAGLASPETLTGARAAAAIMGMNNIYYRSLHLLSDQEYAKLPARLRMNVIGKPGVARTDFELYSLAVSAINGCGMCLDAHERTLRQHEASREAIQSTLRIAAVIHAVAVTLEADTAMEQVRAA